MDFSTAPSDPFESWWPYIIATIVGLVTCIRNYMGGSSCPNDEKINDKIVIVTGASSGIGFETTKELAFRGGQIIMCCKDVKKGVEAMNLIRTKNPTAKLTLKRLDLCSEKSIRDFVKCLGTTQVDILVNNAGIILHPYKKTEEGHEIHTATNYLGHFLLTHLLLENLKKSPQARIINVCCGSYEPANMPLSISLDRKTYVSKEWFAQSKLALILMAKQFSKILIGTNVTINVLNPGLVRGTNHLRHSTIMNRWSVKLSMTPWMWLLMKSPKQGSQTTIYLATDHLVSTTSGKFFSNCSEEVMTGKAIDMDAANALYDDTCKLFKISPLVFKQNK